MTLGIRGVVNKIPFAIGEIIYMLLSIILIINIIKYFIYNKNLIKNVHFWKQTFIVFFTQLLKLYVVFQLIWGLNYRGTNPAEQFNIPITEHYSEAALDSLSLQLIHDLNTSRSKIEDQELQKAHLDSFIEQAIRDYALESEVYAQLTYRQPNIKMSLFPKWGDNFGYLAYYQPITAEAIIRADLPILTQPFSICHEIAHQLGYASETEANFIAFWVTNHSKLPIFNYSMQLQIFSYVQNEQLMRVAKTGDFKKWESIIARNKQLLSAPVLEDRKQIRAFFIARQGKRIPGSEKMYDQFLQWNKQAKGMASYDQVVDWVIAYYKKFPKTDSSTSYSR
jgi:hypothetical protein